MLITLLRPVLDIEGRLWQFQHRDHQNYMHTCVFALLTSHKPVGLNFASSLIYVRLRDFTES